MSWFKQKFMTAEVAIMNKHAVAIAADSAVTFRAMGRQKIFPSAQKIFTLSDCNPVGMMIFGNAEFMGVPWETIIKLYRENLRNKSSDRLEDYVQNFIKFLVKKRHKFFPSSNQKKHAQQQIFSYFSFIFNNIKEENKNILSQKKKVSEKEFKQIINKVIKKHYKIWKESKLSKDISQKDVKELKKQYGEIIDRAKKDVLGKLPITKELSVNLTEIAVSLLTKFSDKVSYSILSGIVFAGYGKNEIFPHLQSVVIEGIANNLLKYRFDKHVEITVEKKSLIVPFAQIEMVYTFMEGVNPVYEREIETDFSQMLDRHLEAVLKEIRQLNNTQRDGYMQRLKPRVKREFEEYKKKLREYRSTNYVQPVMEVVSMLPKDELAILAESLVNLTSLKRRISITEEETVGGPIDVAVISKSDGFIWIKKKTYFDKELNA